MNGPDYTRPTPRRCPECGDIDILTEGTLTSCQQCDWADRRPPHAWRIPPPPPAIRVEMEAAGRTGDDVRLGLAHSRYLSWLADLGIHDTRTGSPRPDRNDA